MTLPASLFAVVVWAALLGVGVGVVVLVVLLVREGKRGQLW